MGAHDNAIPDPMRTYAIPGGAFAVMRDGKLISARGFGYADVESRTPMQPDARFRVASNVAWSRCSTRRLRARSAQIPILTGEYA